MHYLSRERNIRWHWQNLKKEYNTKDWLNGRGWLYIGNAVFSCQWVMPTSRVDISFSIGDVESQLEGNIGCGLFAFYWSLEGVRWLRKYINKSRETSLRFFDGAMWWHIWQDPDEWKSTDPIWRRGTFRPIDVIFGREKHSTYDIDTVIRVINMPESAYIANVRLFISSWKRPRWFQAKTIQRADVSVDGGVPVPGKGENSWDCGEDAVYSLITPATSIDEAVEKFVKSINNTRVKYGGENWVPEKAGQKG